MTYNVAECIRQVRELEAYVEEQEKEFNEKIKPFEDLVEKMRVELLQYLNKTGQKSAPTVYGTARWSPKITYRVIDKDEFRRHVIGSDAWELITWAAAGTACEDFTSAHGATPPGLMRNQVNILYINPPPKPRKKVIPNVGEKDNEDTMSKPSIAYPPDSEVEAL